MSIFGKKASGPIEKKENPTGQAVFLQTRWKAKDRNDALYVKEGYEECVIIYRCIREITTAMASVEIEVHKDGAPIENHPALELLKKPNPTESWAQFLRHILTDYLITGNLYSTKFPFENAKPTELWGQSPLYMKPIPGTRGLPLAYEYKTGAKTITFPVDQISGGSQCFHMKTYNPTNPWLGLSPISHVALAADVHTEGMRWNAALLANGGRPSGIVRFKGQPGKEAIANLKEYFKKAFQGARNAGSIPVLTDDAEWIEMSQSAKDMDFSGTMQTMVKYICSAYGVPLPLVDNDSSTFNNVEQAKERLWTDTVLPLLNEFLEAFGNWLLPAYGDGLSFQYNLDSIPALEGVRTKRFDRMGKGISQGLITPNEGREAIGYEELEGGDELLVPSSLIPLGAEETPAPEAQADLAANPAPKAPSAPDDEEDDPTAEKFLRSIGFSSKDLTDIKKELFDA